jgi:hypothetical protein
MSQRARATIVSILSAAVVASSAGSVAASFQRSYTGETSQGFGIGARVNVNEGRLRLEGFGVRRITLTCEDASTQTWGFGFSWAGRGQRLPDRRFDLDEVDTHDALHVHGRFWPGHARGTVAFAVPALSPEEDAMICASGQLDWEMERTSPNPITSLDISDLDGVMRVRVTEDGDVRIRARHLEP